uniref:DUF4764 domain-containing protein n=1 Tax=Sphenodon punctatus TaxID=8508 RepID=A0A8D0GYE1_SPHPU
MVKKMSQDHFSNFDFLSCKEPVEIKIPKVAESLGITEKLLRKQKIGTAESPPRCSKTTGEQVFTEILEQKRAAESLDEELSPSAKMSRVESLLENANDAYASHNGIKGKSGSFCTLATKEGFNPLNGEVVTAGDGCVASRPSGGRLLAAKQRDTPINLESGNYSVNSETLCQPMKVKMEYAQPLTVQGPDIRDLTAPQKETLLPVDTNVSPGDLVQVHFSSENPGSRLASSDFCDSAISEEVMASQNTNLSVGEENDQTGNPHNNEENQDSFIDEHSQHLNDSDFADQMQQLEKVFSTSIVPINHPYRTQTEPYNPAQGASMSTHMNLDVPVKNLTEFSCGIEEQHAGRGELDNAIPVGETVAFEITDESHDFLSQGHEQIFIQTSDGLILSHPGTTVVSQKEGIVIVTNADGTTMHIGTPDGVPLETVEALLAMEADGQSEDILLSQSEMEP